MKALTIDAPWAWAIIAGHKPVENRSWRTRHRGPLVIHAGLNRRSDAAAYSLFKQLGIAAPTPEELDALRGKVLGVVDVTDMVEDGQGLFATETGRFEFGAWWIGPVGWKLEHPRACEPFAVTGKQGLWDLPAALESRLLCRSHPAS